MTIDLVMRGSVNGLSSELCGFEDDKKQKMGSGSLNLNFERDESLAVRRSLSSQNSSSENVEKNGPLGKKSRLDNLLKHYGGQLNFSKGFASRA